MSAFLASLLSLSLAAQEAPRPPNVLLIVADDVGADSVRCYGERAEAPRTDSIDALASRGVRFTRAYANPWCSPTRAAVLTGRYSMRTGIGYPINRNTDSFALADEETTLPELVERERGAPFDSSAIGKWHLARFADLDAPRRQGFDWFEGSMGNLVGEDNYFSRREVRNGELFETHKYATVEEVDDAIARVNAMREPWFLYLAFNTAHAPFHVPPPESSGASFAEGHVPTDPELYSAMVQSMDREIGRLFAALGPERTARTNVIFLGDNGTPMDALEDRYKALRSKGTLFEGGIRVPLIVAGPSVSGEARACAELVGAVDLFATIAEMFGVDPRRAATSERPIDSVSFLPLLRDAAAHSRRAYLLAEEFRPNGPGPYAELHRALISREWKLGRDLDGSERFFDLRDPARADAPLRIHELTGEQRQRYEALRRELDALTQPPK